MATDRFSFPTPYLRAMADQVASRGEDATAWLARAGVAALDDESVELRLVEFERMILDALERTREPALALFVGQRLPVTAHGVLGYALQSCASIRQAIALFEGFIQLRFSLLALSVEERGGELRVRYRETRPLGAIARPVLEAVIMATKNILESFTSRITYVSFAFPKPTYAELARSLFDAEVRYGAPWSGFALPRHIVDDPVRAADPDAFREAIAVCERELARLPDDPSLAGRVRRLLLEPQRGFPSLEVTARILHLGPRTLHRRLIDEGTSYREILEDVRRTLALEHVRAGHLRMAEIAHQLGYTDLSNFRRAFKRWEGVAPTKRRAPPRRPRARPRRPS